MSGKLSGRTETLTLRVEERFQVFDLVTDAWVQLTRREHERLGVEPGEPVFVRPQRSLSFTKPSPNGAPVASLEAAG